MTEKRAIIWKKIYVVKIRGKLQRYESNPLQKNEDYYDKTETKHDMKIRAKLNKNEDYYEKKNETIWRRET